MHLLLLPVQDGENLPASCRISKDGTFELTDIQDGSYVVRMGAGLGWYMKSARLGSTNVMEHGLQVEKGAPAGNLEIIVSSESAQLNGLVTLDDKPLPGAHVRLMPDPETLYNRARTQTKTTDQTGQFSIDGIAPGRYRIVARFFDASKSEQVPSSQPQIVTLTEHDRQKINLKVIPADGEQN